MPADRKCICFKSALFGSGTPLQHERISYKDTSYLAIRKGIEMLLHHWEHQTERKIYLFGIGTDFRKLKYPYVWYNILHVVEVLSRFPEVHNDPRFLEMVTIITEQADRKAAIQPTRCIWPGKAGHLPTKKNLHPG